MIDQPRWNHIQMLFDEALELPEAEQTAYVNSAGAGDASVIAEVLAMLKQDRRGGSILDRGLSEVALNMVSSFSGEIRFKEIGPYVLERFLGEGGMGVVYLARRKDAGNLVAIKILLHAALSPARRERFANEIKTLGKLKHPWIARLYDAGTLDDGTSWFVMEYVEGKRFTQYSRHLQLREQLQLFRSVCEAVQYAHTQEIVHRDLKPSNILVEADGTPKLLDFGIARELHHVDRAVEDRTHPGLRFMSPDYAAPEWVRDGDVGSYTDVYSLGVILYEMITGQLPFTERHHATDPDGTSLASLPEKPSISVRLGGSLSGTRPSSVSKAEWNDLDVLCLKAMHHDVAERYRSVEALIRDIDHYLKAEPLEARPDTLRYRASKFCRRNRRTLVAAGLALTTVTVLAAIFAVRLATARRAELAQTARRQRIQRFMLNLLGDGDQEAAPSGDLKVVTMLDRGSKEAASLSADPETQAEIYRTLGTMYDRLGKFERADDLLSASLEKMKEVHGPQDPKVAEALVQLGVLKADRGQSDGAERDAEQGLQLAEKHLPPGDPVVVAAKAEYGRILVESGKYQRAIEVLEPVTQLTPKNDAEAYAVKDSLSALEVAQFDATHYGEAESLSNRVIVLDREMLGESHPQTGFDVMNLGSVKLMTGRYADAEALYRRASAIITDWYGSQHPDAATCMSLLARALTLEGKYPEAKSILDEVLSIQEKNYGPVHVRVAFTYNTLGKLAVARGDLAEAETDFTHALSIDRALYGDKNQQTATNRSDLGNVYLKEEKYKPAEENLREAVDGYPPGNPNLGVAEARWGHSLLELGRYDDAQRELSVAYRSLRKLPATQSEQVENVCHDLASVYDAGHKSQKALGSCEELADGDANHASH